MLNPVTGGRLELDLATGMFIEEYSNTNSIDTNNSSGYAIDGKAKIEQQINVGDASDGDVTVPLSGTYTMDTDSLISNRTVPDAVAFNADSFTTNTVVLTDTPSGIAAGDEVIIYCAQGHGTHTRTSGNTAPNSRRVNVGNYEFLTVDSVDAGSKTITFTTTKEKYYGNASGSDSTVGTGGSEMKVIVQRVPHYANLTVSESATMTASRWNGTKGGLMIFRVGGTLTNNGIIDAAGIGYRGGPAGAAFSSRGATGESIMGGPFGYSSDSIARNDAGGGSHSGKGTGGNHHGDDELVDGNTTGNYYNYTNPYDYLQFSGNILSSITDYSKLLFGSGGAGVRNGHGGDGGGIIYFHANVYVQDGTANIRSSYHNGGWSQPSDSNRKPGYGAGGEIQIFVNSVTLTGNSFSVAGAGYTANGSVTRSSSGRFRMTYVSLSGSIYSGTYFYSSQIAGAFSTSAIIQSTNILSSAGQVDSIQSLLTTMNTLPGSSAATVQFAQGTGTGYYWQDSTGGSGLSNTIPIGTSQTTSLSSLNWSGSNFYYKISLSGNGSATPIIDQLKVDYSPDIYIGTEQNWISQALGDGTKRISPTSFTAYWTDDSDSIKPKYQLIGSNTSDFASTNVYPGASDYYQDGGTYDIDNAVSFDLTTAVTQYNKYWKIKVYISSGPTITDAPTVDRVKLNVNLESDFDNKGIAQAWVNFIGVTGGNATITDSLNVSSVNRISTGVYNVNFSENFDDANYMFTAGGYQNDGGWPVAPVRDLTGAISASGYQIAIVSGQTRIDSTGEGVYLSFLGS
jgi:hypothetical protein